MENPYQPPRHFESLAFNSGYSAPNEPRPRGMVGHVRPLGILILVQGALLLMMGVMFGVLAVMLPPILAAEMDRNAGPKGPTPEFMQTFLTVFYGVDSVLIIVLGILHCVAGFSVFRFRSRGLGIVTVCLSALSILGCYCGPTGIALLIYGLIVLLNDSVREAFALVQQGYTPEQIDSIFPPGA